MLHVVTTGAYYPSVVTSQLLSYFANVFSIRALWVGKKSGKFWISLFNVDGNYLHPSLGQFL